MIKTLKSELKLRPTYDEMIGMIESQGDPNRPSIEQVIDRRATIFRNNQFGSQFDNIDFLGLKKQEEDRAKEDLRRASVRKVGIEAGTSTGLMGIDTTGFVEPSIASGLSTPAIVNEDVMLRPFPTDEEIDEIRRNLRASNDLRKAEEQVRKQQFEISQMAKNDLSDVHSQQLPEGVPVHSMTTDEDDLPPLEPITTQSNQGYPPSLPPPPQQEARNTEDKEKQRRLDLLNELYTFQFSREDARKNIQNLPLHDFSKIEPEEVNIDGLLTLFRIAEQEKLLQDDEISRYSKLFDENSARAVGKPREDIKAKVDELFKTVFHNESVGEEEDEELTALEQKVAYTSGFDPDKVMEDDSVNYKGLMFQLHVRDLLTPETIELLNKIPTDQKKKKYLVSLMEGLKENDEWNADFNSEKLSRKIKEFKKIRRRVKSKVVEASAGSSSSSGGGIGSAIASGAKAVGGAVLEAGKEAVKEAVVAGARNAVMSLI